MRVFVGAIALFAACGGAGDSRCSSRAECLPSYVCRDGFCVTSVDMSGAMLGCGPEGCVIDGPDGARLVVPKGALGEPYAVKLAEASAGLSTRGVEPVSKIFALEPARLALLLEASVVIPVDPRLGLRPADLFVWTSTDGAVWRSLPGQSTAAEAIGRTRSFGLVVAGRAR